MSQASRLATSDTDICLTSDDQGSRLTMCTIVQREYCRKEQTF